MKIINLESRFPIQTSETRLVWKRGSLSTSKRAKSEQYPKQSIEAQQNPIASVSLDDAKIFDFLRSQSGDTAEEKWEKFANGKNLAEIYELLFEGIGAKMKDFIPTTHTVAVEYYFFTTSALHSSATKALRIRELRDAFINHERKERSTATLSFDTDIQNYLDDQPNSKAWLKNPYLWFNPETKSYPAVARRINRVYDALFGSGPENPLTKKVKPTGKNVEEAVFGSPATSVEDKRKRLEIWQNHLNDTRALELKTVKALREMKEGGVIAETEKVLETINDEFSDAEPFGKVLMIASVVAVINSIWVGYKMLTDPNYRKEKSTIKLALEGIAGFTGLTHLIRKGTYDRVDLLDELLITSNLDEVDETGLRKVLEKLNITDEPSTRAMLMLAIDAKTDVLFEEYLDKRTATDPEEQKISIAKVTNDKAKATKTVTDHDAFLVAHQVFTEYGKRYFKFATGRLPENPSEEMQGARLFVEYHTFSGAKPSLLSALTREENTAKNPKEFRTHFKNRKGIFLRFVETVKALIQAPVHPILTAEYLGKNIQWIARNIGVDVNWFNDNVDGDLTDHLENLYNQNSPAIRAKLNTYLNNIGKFCKTEWKQFIADKQGYIKNVTDNSVTFVLKFGRDVIECVYDVGSGAVLGVAEVGGKVKRKIDTFSVNNLGGKPILDTPFIPYWYDTATNTWQFGTLNEAGSLAKKGAKGAGNIAADVAGYTLAWGTEAVKATGGGMYEIGKGALKYTEAEAISRWNTVFKPKLKSWGIKDLESLGAAGPKMVVWCSDWLIDQSIDRGGKFLSFSGRQIGDVYDASERLFWAMGVALKKKARWTEKEFKEYLQEWANKQPGIDEFNTIVVDKASEKKYFSGKPAKKALEELLPKARDWLFTRFRWWNIDIDADSVAIDESDMSITFNNFTVERTGIHTEIQGIDYSLLRNSAECSLKINFDKNGLPTSKKRFVLSYIPRGHTKKEVKQLGLADLSNHEFLKNIVNTPLPSKPPTGP